MKCPTCGAWTFVKETRARPDGSTRRRYECANEHRFTTTETITTKEKKCHQDQHTTHTAALSHALQQGAYQ